MRHFILATVLLLITARLATAHFAYIVPLADNKAQVVLSESLKPDEEVDIGIIEKAAFFARDNRGQEAALKLEKVDHALQTEVSVDKAQLLHGSCEAGIMQRDNIKPFLIRYFPKSILGNPFDAKATVGGDTPMELVAVGAPGELKFLALLKGKPVASTDVHVILPGGKETKISTDKDGLTVPFDKPGRYGAWFKAVDPTSGESGGKAYTEIRNYATLVIDVEAAKTK